MRMRSRQLVGDLGSLVRGGGWKLPFTVALLAFVPLALIAIAIGGNVSIGFHPDTSANRLAHISSPTARFALLRDNHSNRCSLQAETVATLPVAGRLQGACCAPMNFAHYKRQLRGLESYRAVPLVPADPYDVSVRLAARLIASDRQIQLGQPERGVYDRAVGLSKEHGPCCCQCWRWSAFAGQAKRLITHSHYRASEVARVWDLEDGCGGRA